MLALFAKTILRHLYLWIGGPAVSLGLTALDWFGPFRLSKTTIVASGVAAGFAFAAFRSWRDERQRGDGLDKALTQLKEARPVVAARFVVDGFYLLLEVDNRGIPAQFRATIETDTGVHGRPLQPMPGIWDLTDSHEPLEIDEQSLSRIRIASLLEDRTFFYTPDNELMKPDYGWKLYFHRLPGHRGWFEGRIDLDDEQPTDQWFTATIVVRSQPRFLEGTLVKKVQFVGRGAVDLDTNERFAPRAQVHDDNLVDND